MFTLLALGLSMHGQ